MKGDLEGDRMAEAAGRIAAAQSGLSCPLLPVYDVAVVGASSAGLYAAELLARAGRRVAVFEQQAELAPSRRTLIVTPQLQRLLGNLPDSVVLHRIPVMAVASRSAAARVALRDPDLIVERGELTRLLGGRAQQAGAELHFGYSLQSLDPHPDGASLLLRAAGGRVDRVTARAVVGADGLSGQVAAAAGLERPPAVPILQAEVRLPPGWDPAVTQVWFDSRDTRFFYWLIPESTETGVAGLVGDGRFETRAALQHFLDLHGLRAAAWQGARVALHHPRMRPWGQIGAARVLLVGDAAGQVKVSTVGGTVSGLVGAAAAAQALVHDTPYARELRPLKRELDLHWLIRHILDRLDNPGYDRLIGSLTPRTRELLGRYHRDAMAGVFWRVLLLQPGLLALGARLLVRRSNDETLERWNVRTFQR